MATIAFVVNSGMGGNNKGKNILDGDNSVDNSLDDFKGNNNVDDSLDCHSNVIGVKIATTTLVTAWMAR